MYNEYNAFFKGKKVVIHSDTSFHALQEAASVLNVNPKHHHLIGVVLVGLDNGKGSTDPVTHNPAIL